MRLCWSTQNSSYTSMKKVSSSKRTTLLEGRYSIKWLTGPFRWSQFYNNNKTDLPPAHDATTQAVGVLIPVCFLCITTLGRQNLYFFLVPAKQHHKSHADHRKSFISAWARIHIWDYQKQKHCLRYITNLYLIKKQASWGGDAGEEAVIGLNYRPLCLRNISLKLQSKPEGTDTALGTLTQERKHFREDRRDIKPVRKSVQRDSMKEREREVKTTSK